MKLVRQQNLSGILGVATTTVLLAQGYLLLVITNYNRGHVRVISV